MGLLFGGTPDAVATAVTDEFAAPNSSAAVRYQMVVPRATFRVFDAETAGNRITGLRDATGAAVSATVTADNNGQIPTVQLPDALSVAGVWLDPDDASAARFFVPCRTGLAPGSGGGLPNGLAIVRDATNRLTSLTVTT